MSLPNFNKMTPDEIRAYWATPEGKKISKKIQDGLDKSRQTTERLERERANQVRCTCCPVHKRMI